MDNKNIDRLFQENLKNLEATPNKRVWNSIESKLTSKKRRLIPFWWFTSGIAALFILGLLLFPISGDKNKLHKNDTNVIISNTSDDKKENTKTIKSDSIILHKNDTKQILIANDKPILKKQNIIERQEVKKKVVSTKNAMKKIFFANNNKNLSSTKDELSKNKNEKKFIKKAKNNKIKSTKKIDISSLTQKKDTINLKKLKDNKWAIAPVFGVLNSNSFSDSSPIQQSLSNSTVGQNSLSFGVQVGYRINKKWTIQTGIHRQEVTYTNNNVNVVIASMPARRPNVSLKNRPSVSFESLSTQSADFSADVSINSINLSGDLSQTFGYIEIPVEVKYQFLNSKNFDTQIVAGFSSLFLNKNEVNFNTQIQTETGRTNNLNNINFSGNIGLDFNYLVTKKWSINLNPMFKAQLNTFDDDANGFAPFNLGVYTGIKYRF